jgi:Tfp pilus assembly protein PilO
MNSIISKAFVFLNDVLSTFVVGLILFIGLVLMVSGWFVTGLLVATIGTVLLIGFFGFAAMMIEMNKNLEAINQNLKQLKNSYDKNNEPAPARKVQDSQDQQKRDLDSMVSKIDSNKVDQFKNIIDSKNK